MKVKTTFLTLIISIFFGLNTFAGNSISDSSIEPQDKRVEIKEIINHHLLDDHNFTITHGVSFPLPVIVYSKEVGLDIFMSSGFGHVIDGNGENIVTKESVNYKLYHGKIYLTDKLGTITYDRPLDFSITKNVFFIMVCFLLMIIMFGKMARSYKNGPIPTGMGRLLEPLILFVRDDIALPNIGEKSYKRYMSFLLTIFFFIWIINLFGLTPLGVNVTNNIAVTASLAVLTYIITTFTANKNYWGHIFWMPGVPVPMKILLAPIELLGTIIKPFSLMIRLYANIIAGHVVLMSILGLIFIFQNWIGGTLSFGLAFALSLLELLVAALQAYIFTMLSALYFGAAVEEHHEEH